jgi:hypothetical protein
MQFVMSRNFKSADSLPKPKQGTGVDFGEQGGGVYAALRFNGIGREGYVSF